MGGPPPERGRRGQTELLVRDARRALAPRGGRILFTDRHTVRSTDRRLWRQDHQHIAPMGRRCAQLFRLSGIQQRRFCRRAGRDSRGRIADPGALSRRFHQHGTGPALRAGVFPGRLLIGRSRPALPPQQCRLEHVSRQGRDSAQRHASDDGGAGVDADPARRGASRVGPGLGSDAEDVGLHQSHSAARSAREMAARLVPDDAAAPSGDHLRDQSAFPRRRPDPLSRRRGACSAREPGRGRRRAENPHGQPRHRRLAQHQRCLGDSHRPAADDDGQRPGRDVSGALQQQDQRRHAATMAVAGEPGARRRHHGRPSATAG